jgi:signal transduction histidine kinase
MDRGLLRLNILLEATAAWGRSSSFEALATELHRIKWVLEFQSSAILVAPTTSTGARAFLVGPAGASLTHRSSLPSEVAQILTDTIERGRPQEPADGGRVLSYPLESGSTVLGAICFIAGEVPYQYHDVRFARFIAEALAGILDRLIAREDERHESEGSRRKDEFLAMLGHELRNPLAPMVTAIELLKTESPTRAARDCSPYSSGRLRTCGGSSTTSSTSRESDVAPSRWSVAASIWPASSATPSRWSRRRWIGSVIA